MREEGTSAVGCRRRYVKESGRIKDASTASAISGRGRRSQPQKHLLRPLIEAAIGNIGKGDAVCGIDHAVQRYASRLKPTRKYRSGDGTSRLSVRGQGLWIQRRRRRWAGCKHHNHGCYSCGQRQFRGSTGTRHIVVLLAVHRLERIVTSGKKTLQVPKC